MLLIRFSEFWDIMVKRWDEGWIISGEYPLETAVFAIGIFAAVMLFYVTLIGIFWIVQKIKK